jgi:hypothetical protein
MGEGGHFLSDVIFAAVFMALDVALMHWLVFHVFLQRTPHEAWWHDKTIALTEELHRRSVETIAAGKEWLRRTFPETFGSRLAAKDPLDGGDPPP